jgi:hypothetical protein
VPTPKEFLELIRAVGVSRARTIIDLVETHGVNSSRMLLELIDESDYNSVCPKGPLMTLKRAVKVAIEKAPFDVDLGTEYFIRECSKLGVNNYNRNSLNSTVWHQCKGGKLMRRAPGVYRRIRPETKE